MKKPKRLDFGWIDLRGTQLSLRLVTDRDNGHFINLRHSYWDSKDGKSLTNEIELTRLDFIALLRFGLTYLEVKPELIESVVPKLTRANIVK
jgi:hypothetical protein